MARSRRIRARKPVVQKDSTQLRKQIQSHNARVKWFLKQRLVPTARHALLFPIIDIRPQLVLLPARDEWDPACGCPAYPEDLDADDWFKGPQSVASVDSFPGTMCHLANGYDLITLSENARRMPTATANETLRRLFSIHWPGSVLVVKRARRHRGAAVHITASEVSLISAVVQRWLQIKTKHPRLSRRQ
ncbi:hypothetical protein OH77DRAFT_1592280 [Trametes cingulata]|nr:hypothetical protein OH77DRAFT_1592280 [Trametes cingulata]